MAFDPQYNTSPDNLPDRSGSSGEKRAGVAQPARLVTEMRRELTSGAVDASSACIDRDATEQVAARKYVPAPRDTARHINRDQLKPSLWQLSQRTGVSATDRHLRRIS